MGRKTLFAIMAGAVVLVSAGLYAATNFPTSLDTYSDKTPNDLITSAGWNALQDAIEALEAKVGIDSSPVVTSHDYKINQLEGYWTTSGLSKPDLINLNGITATYAQINNSSKMVYGAAGGGVLRIIQVVIAYYDKDECQITITSLWNGDSLSPTRHSSEVAYYDFNCTGNCLGVVGVFLTNSSSEVFPNARPWAASVSNNLRISICPTIGGSYGHIGDILSSLGQSVAFTVAYLTSE